MDDVTEIELHLQKGLRHVSAPHGFTDRVMERVHDGHVAPPVSKGVLYMPSRYPWLAAAATLLLVAAGTETLHVRHQQQAQAAAQMQVDRALQLTSHAMNEVETGFQRSPAGRYAKLWTGQ